MLNSVRVAILGCGFLLTFGSVGTAQDAGVVSAQGAGEAELQPVPQGTADAGVTQASYVAAGPSYYAEDRGICERMAWRVRTFFGNQTERYRQRNTQQSRAIFKNSYYERQSPHNIVNYGHFPTCWRPMSEECYNCPVSSAYVTWQPTDLDLVTNPYSGESSSAGASTTPGVPPAPQR